MSQTPATQTQAPAAQAPVEAGDNSQAPAEKKRVGIFNLPPGIKSKDDLRDLCKTFGAVADVEFFAARGPKMAFAFVTFKSTTDAEYAIYRLKDNNLGGKGPAIKASFPRDTPKRDPVTTGPRPEKKKVKKPMTSLVTLTPKNAATPVPVQAEGAASPVKKAWGAVPAEAPKGRNPYPKREGQQQPNQAAPAKKAGGRGAQNAGNNQPAAPVSPPHTQAASAPVPVVPAVQAQPVQNQAQAAGNQQGPKTKKPKKNNQNQGQNPAQNPGQTHQPQNQNQVAPAQNQAAPIHPTQPAQNQVGQPKNPKKKNGPKAANPAAPVPVQNAQPVQQTPRPPYRLTVTDAKTNLALHVLDLSQAQYDKHVAPLVVVKH